MDDEKRPDDRSDESDDPKAAPVDGPGGDEGPGGLGGTSQDAPGDVEGGGTSGV